jgi:protein TonB
LSISARQKRLSESGLVQPPHSNSPRARAYRCQPSYSTRSLTSSNSPANAGAGGDDIAPGPPAPLSHNNPPRYPDEARRRGIEGTVVLRIEVLENGTVGDISALTSSGSELLDSAAIEAVKQSAFEPATVDGKPQRWRGELPIRFLLQG